MCAHRIGLDRFTDNVAGRSFFVEVEFQLTVFELLKDTCNTSFDDGMIGAVASYELFDNGLKGRWVQFLVWDKHGHRLTYGAVVRIPIIWFKPTSPALRYTVTMDANGPEESKSEQRSQKNADRTATAYHEAGHAVMAIMLGRPIEKVSILPAKMQNGGGRLGHCKMQKGRTKPSKDELEDDVLILLAGMVAESHFTGRYCPLGAGQDLQTIERILANRARSERQLNKLVRRYLDKTEHLLADEVAAKAVMSIANEVLQRETISGRAVRHLYQQAEKAH